MADLPGNTLKSQAGLYALVVLLILGVGLWATAGLAYVGADPPWTAALVAGLLVLFASTFRQQWPFVDRFRNFAAKHRYLVAAVVFAFSVIYLGSVAWLQHRDLRPAVSDEFGYLVSARMLAHGRLWMPEHLLGDFFESYQMLVKHVYASSYFPGTAIFLLPAMWLGAPAWVVMLTIAAAIVSFIYLTAEELFDPWTGILAVVMTLSTGMFRTLAFSVLSQLPVLLLGLSLFYTFLRWRAKPRRSLAILMGVLTGWAAVTRPVDALCFAIPAAIAVLWHIRRDGTRAIITTVLVGLAGIAPFAALQMVFNKNVTGSWTTTPFTVNAERDNPGTTFGFHDTNVTTRPTSTIAQKQVLYDEWVAPMVEKHRPDLVLSEWTSYRLPMTFMYALPNLLLVALLPVALLSLRTWPRIALVAVFPCFVVLYAFYTFYLPHYAITVMPVLVLLIAANVGVVGKYVVVRSASPAAGLWAAIAALAIASAPPIADVKTDRMIDTPTLDAADRQLATLTSPAIVLFKYTPGQSSPHEEPVYNTDVAWPDDARIIRAHDLGGRNTELFGYYATRQPDRQIYRFDRSDNSLQFLGSAGELARQRP